MTCAMIKVPVKFLHLISKHLGFIWQNKYQNKDCGVERTWTGCPTFLARLAYISYNSRSADRGRVGRFLTCFCKYALEILNLGSFPFQAFFLNSGSFHLIKRKGHSCTPPPLSPVGQEISVTLYIAINLAIYLSLKYIVMFALLKNMTIGA